MLHRRGPDIVVVCLGWFPAVCEWTVSTAGLSELLVTRAERRRFLIERTVTAWAREERT